MQITATPRFSSLQRNSHSPIKHEASAQKIQLGAKSKVVLQKVGKPAKKLVCPNSIHFFVEKLRLTRLVESVDRNLINGPQAKYCNKKGSRGCDVELNVGSRGKLAFKVVDSCNLDNWMCLTCYSELIGSLERCFDSLTVRWFI